MIWIKHYLIINNVGLPEREEEPDVMEYKDAELGTDPWLPMEYWDAELGTTHVLPME